MTLRVRSAMSSRMQTGIPSLRGGFTLIEMIATCGLLAAVIAFIMPLLLVIHAERRATEQRQFALQHLANLLERPSLISWNELPVGPMKAPELSADLVAVLPGAEHSLEVRNVSDDENARQIVARIRWLKRAELYYPEVQLVRWVTRSEEAQP